MQDIENFSFTKDKPLIGLIGFSGSESINGLTVIRYELESECHKELVA